MKPIEMLKEIKNVLGIELSEETPVQEEVQEVQEVALAQMTLENGTILEAEAFESDQEVFIVTEDERVAVPVGEYTLEDGRILKVAEEGIIAEIAEASSEESVEEEMADHEEEEMYATKAELNEIRSMVEEMYNYMKDKEEMSKEVQDEEVAEELKEELSKPASEPIKHSPEVKEDKQIAKFSINKPQTTLDRVFQKLNNR